MEIERTSLANVSWSRVSRLDIEGPISTQCWAMAARITRVRQTKMPLFHSAPSRSNASARGLAGFLLERDDVTGSTFRERAIASQRKPLE
jgi:hypothetical protein